jgi:DNA-binding MarR family transcriptional regulator
MTWRVEDRAAGSTGPRTFVIEESLGYLINRAARAFANRLAEQLRPFDVGIGQWAVLLHLWGNDGMTQAQLARRVAIEQPTMVRTIDRMERDGLVRRVRDARDRRRVNVFLTDKGRALRDPLVPCAVATDEAATRALTGAELEQAKDLLRRMTEALESAPVTHEE